jgi:NAD(P)-dependent dehydrogenase (short-subunit alcohol dehydrogenase family)
MAGLISAPLNFIRTTFLGRDVRNGVEYSLADQVARFARATKEKNPRYLDINTVYDGSSLKGKRVLVTGAEQGLGLELVKEIVKQGGVAVQAGRTSSADLDAVAAGAPGKVEIITGIDVTSDDAMKKLAKDLKAPVDILINCAGYFYGPEEFVGVGATHTSREGHLNFKQQMLMIDICSVGVLRVTNAVYKAGKLAKDGKIIIITSQAGSCEWRLTQNPPSDAFVGNYGHHMSRASCHIMGVLLAQEFKTANIPVQMLHPGFNRTAMTKKYEHIWDIEGAVEPEVGAKRVLYESLKADMSTTGTVINCEDGLRIPW